MGPDAKSEESQRQVHKWIDCDEPEGWDNQMPNEPMFNVYQDRYYRLLHGTTNSKFGYRLYGIVGGTIGTTFVNGRVGTELRGAYNIPRYSFPGGIVAKGAHASWVHRLINEFFIYCVGGIHEEMVLHNATIGDSLFRNREPGQERDLEFFVSESKHGIVTGFEHFSLSYLYYDRAEEFRCQGDGGMEYGMIRIEFNKQF
jgi:hypothetical protein